MQRDFSGNCATEPAVCQPRAADTGSSGRRGPAPRRGVRHPRRSSRRRSAGRSACRSRRSTAWTSTTSCSYRARTDGHRDDPQACATRRLRHARRARRCALTLLTLAAAALLASVRSSPMRSPPRSVPQHRATLEQPGARRDRTRRALQRAAACAGAGTAPRRYFGRRAARARCGARAAAAPRLIVGRRPWRMLRSGELAAVPHHPRWSPTSTRPHGCRARCARRACTVAARRRERRRPADLLARWRGERIDVEGGTLRVPRPAGSGTAILAIRYAQLRRLGERVERGRTVAAAR